MSDLRLVQLEDSMQLDVELNQVYEYCEKVNLIIVWKFLLT